MNTRLFLVVTVTALVLAGVVTQWSSSPSASSATKPRVAHASTAIPTGTPDAAEPSGMAPPTAGSMTGYQLSYATDFTGSSLPSGWKYFSGAPSGDAGSLWATSHVQVSGGLLQLNTFQDSALSNAWVSGGLCQCGLARTYGAYFVRSRMTGAGPTQVELLWPAKGNSWPPEIDFDETYGPTTTSMATLHYTSSNQQIHNTVTIDMTQWHTWGVIWTPTSVDYTVDGRIWGSVTTAGVIPSVPMTLDIQQQTWCSSGFACPTGPASTDVDWVAEFSASSSSSTTTTTTTTTTPPTTTTTGSPTSASAPVTLVPFRADSAVLTASLKRQIARLAHTIVERGDRRVLLSGYVSPSRRPNVALSRARAVTVRNVLERDLRALHAGTVSIHVVGEGDANPVSPSTSLRRPTENRRVVALLS